MNASTVTLSVTLFHGRVSSEVLHGEAQASTLPVQRPTAKHNIDIYYCRFRDENGTYMSPISTLQFSKAAARNWADQKLNEGKIM
jgi:hypothetical protein